MGKKKNPSSGLEQLIQTPCMPIKTIDRKDLPTPCKLMGEKKKKNNLYFTM